MWGDPKFPVQENEEVVSLSQAGRALLGGNWGNRTKSVLGPDSAQWPLLKLSTDNLQWAVSKAPMMVASCFQQTNHLMLRPSINIRPSAADEWQHANLQKKAPFCGNCSYFLYVELYLRDQDSPLGDYD